MSKFEEMWNQEQAAGEQRRADRPLSFYGKLSLEGRYVVLQKGFPGGKRDFDPDGDPEDAKRMCVRVRVEPVSERALNPFEREFLVSSAEGNLFRDAVASLGTTVAALTAGAYVRLDVVEDARLGSFNDRTTGAPRTRSTGLIREVFPDEAACRAASDARYSGGASVGGASWAGIAGNPASPAGGGTTPVNAGKPIAPENVPGVGKGLNRETAAKFFPGIWQRASGDPDKFLEELAANKVMTRHFGATTIEVVQAPEVLEFLTKVGHPEYAQDAADKGGDVDLEETPF